ncbi:MAG: hypothetical protein LBP88_00425, partial [Treponema sp.]|nr:hypothetical protein [Treponema sp.]
MKARYRFTAWERLGLAPKRQRREARNAPLACRRGPSRAVNPLAGSLAGLLLFASAGLGFGQTVSLEGAIAGALEGIRQKAPAGAVAAVAQFQADSPKLSDYVLGELASGLVSRGRVKVVERQQINMDMVQKSLA